MSTTAPLPDGWEDRLAAAAEPLVQAAREAAIAAIRPWYERKAKATLRARGEGYAEPLAAILTKAVGVPVDGYALYRAAYDSNVDLGLNPTRYDGLPQRGGPGAGYVERDNDDHLDRVAYVPDSRMVEEDMDPEPGPDDCPDGDECDGYVHGDCRNPCRDGDCHYDHCLNRDDNAGCCVGCALKGGATLDDCPDPDDHHEINGCCGYCEECDDHDARHDAPERCDKGHCHECDHECD